MTERNAPTRKSTTKYITLAEYREKGADGKVYIDTYFGRLEVTGIGPGAGWVITGQGLSQRSFLIGEDGRMLVESEEARMSKSPDVLEIHRDNLDRTGWITFRTADGRIRGEAKIYRIPDGSKEEPADWNGYGLEPGSRISKLLIIEGGEWVYEWERGDEEGDRSKYADIIARLEEFAAAWAAETN